MWNFLSREHTSVIMWNKKISWKHTVLKNTKLAHLPVLSLRDNLYRSICLTDNWHSLHFLNFWIHFMCVCFCVYLCVREQTGFLYTRIRNLLPPKKIFITLVKRISKLSHFLFPWNLLIGLMMEAVSTPETSVNFYQTTRRNNPKGSHVVWRFVRAALIEVQSISKPVRDNTLLCFEHESNPRSRSSSCLRLYIP
jgi:hypothetical protein